MSYQALLFCPDEKTARVVTHVLTELDFAVDLCNEPFAVVKKMMAQHFDAIVVDCENEQNATLLFKSARNSAGNQGMLAVALVEGQAGVAKAFRIGANLVLTKPINVEQSKGTLRVARGLLRKHDFSKPAAAPPAGSDAAPWPSAAQSVARPTSPQTIPTQLRNSSPPPPANRMLEVEAEPAPQPDSAEAALLESMPEPLPAGKVPAIDSPAKPSPWQPLPNASEPMRSALRSAAHVTSGAAETGPSKTEPVTAPPAPAGISSGMSGMGAAAAPAPAKQPPKNNVTPFQPKPPRPQVAASNKPDEVQTVAEDIATTQEAASIGDSAHFGTTFGEQPASAETNRKPVIFAVAVLLLAAAGYFGWTKFAFRVHSAAPSAPAAVHPQAPATGAPMITQASPAPASPQPAPVASAVVTPEPAAPVPSKPSAAKPAHPQPETVTATQDVTVKNLEQPVVVKNTAPSHAQQPQVEPPPVAPPAMIATENPDTKALAGIVSAPIVSIPKPAPAPQTLRVSQGVSQGLLVKRVQPVYPPQALQMRIGGAVELEATIAKDGSISKVRVVKGDPVLARAASDAVQKWKYRPYFLNGEPVEIQTGITVNFKLP